MKDALLIPFSIIIAGILIGGGLYMSKNSGDIEEKTIDEAIKQASNMEAIDPNDHLLGNPSARVIIVEYSDTECPFCKEFHKTLRAIMTEYGTNGDMSWIYRHLPIAELHSKAPKEAEALECAGELGGNAKFWEYTNRIYEITPSNNNLPASELTNVAKQVGLSSEKFNACLESGKYATKVKSDVDDAFKAGAEGTPFSIIIDTKNGDTYPVNGAYPYSQLKNIIDLILQS
ncbi:MAG TPA: thioredoxin domain-containing protein [Candidatus Paceibacterota bacterium]